MKTFQRFYSFLNIKKQPVPSSRIDKDANITNWGVKNNFPQQLLATVNGSPAGSSAVRRWQEFTEGKGLADIGIGMRPVNPKETLDELHSKVAKDLASMWGFAIVVQYNLEGERTEWHHLPFETTRLGNLSTGETKIIKYNPYYGTKDYDKKDTKVYYDYNPDPDHVIKEMREHNKNAKDKKNEEINGKYPGQVFWFGIEEPLARVYPSVFYYSAINWFKLDGDIQDFHKRNIDNNMILSVVMNIFGDPDAPAGPETTETNADGDVTQADQYETNAEVLGTQLKAFTKEKGGVFVNWFKKLEEKADIQAFPNNSNHDLFLTLQNIVTDQVAIGTQVPRILLNIAQAGKLGDTQELINAVRVMQAQTAHLREILSRTYLKLFGKGDYTIKNTTIDVLPDWAIAEMSAKEKRDYIQSHFDVTLDEEIPEPVSTEQAVKLITQAWQQLT